MQILLKATLCVILVTLLMPAYAYSQSCNLNRKTVGFKVTMCSQRGCNTGVERVDFVGDKVIHYSDRLAAEGTVYEVGKTVNFCDPRSQNYRPRLCRNEAGPVAASGTVSFIGSDIVLQKVENFAVQGVPARNTQTIRIRMEGCDACKVVQLTIDVVSLDPRHPVRDGSQMAGSESELCQVVDTTTLPH